MIKWQRKAIQALAEGAEYNADIVNDSLENIVWLDDTNLTESEINAKAQELKSAEEYKDLRAASYPNMKEQLDMLWHAIDAGALDTTSDFYTTLAAVKNNNPKPE